MQPEPSAPNGAVFPKGIRVFSTCPPSSASAPGEYLAAARRAATWSEAAGCEGMLVYTDNSLVDPWVVAALVLEATTSLAPLVAVQPVYMHPYSVAKLVTSLGALFGRRVCLNMVAGGFVGDLAALDDRTPHDRRYDRLVEFTRIVTGLLENPGPMTFEGEFYRTVNLKLSPVLPADLRPGVFVSGSSEAGLKAAADLDAVVVHYPKPPAEYGIRPGGPTGRQGVRVGLIAREDRNEAWAIARARFPEDRKGQFTHQVAMKVSDSAWHRQLSDLAHQEPSATNPYWLVPFENYKTFCPYIVGDYGEVASLLARYLQAGFGTFILDVPAGEHELQHSARAFHLALSGAGSGP